MQIGFEASMRNYDIDIFRLSNELHQYEFEIDQTFFQSLDQDLVENGSIKAWVDLDKNERFIALDFKLEGTLELTCDRSLDTFDHAIKENHKVIFKYGDIEQELAEDVMMITDQTQQINVGQFLFEFIGLALPMKRLHPRYLDEDNEENSLVYSSQDDPEEASDDMDPRWKELKRLKKN